jgi:phage baseplate assembly protein W
MNNASADTAFLGQGWSFPPTFDRYSRGVALVPGVEDIEQSIRLIFSIAPGERQMLPQFACDLGQFVFGPNDSSVEAMIESEVRAALRNYEPRIYVEAVTVTPDPGNAPAGILIAVDYTVSTTNRRYNLVFPYYLNEATGIAQ